MHQLLEGLDSFHQSVGGASELPNAECQQQRWAKDLPVQNPVKKVCAASKATWLEMSVCSIQLPFPKKTFFDRVWSLGVLWTVLSPSGADMWALAAVYLDAQKHLCSVAARMEERRAPRCVTNHLMKALEKQSLFASERRSYSISELLITRNSLRLLDSLSNTL